MFVRKNRNRSGSVSIQIISKNNGRYRVVQTLGSSSDSDEIALLTLAAKQIITHPQGQLKLLSLKSPDDLVVETFVHTLSNSQVHTVGPELIFGTLFDRIGFNVVSDKLFRHIVIARLAYPTSKLKTVDYLYRYQGINVSVDAVYRFLDKLHSTHKPQVEQIAYEYTKKRLGGTVSVIFYDLTTLYFEAEDEDDLRQIGFSKDGQFQKPQILLGLLVGKHGLPIGYHIFEGKTFEGHTLIPILKEIQIKYGFRKPVVIADAALLSEKNLKNLSEHQYRFIIGGRIKNETQELKHRILKRAKKIKDGHGFSIKKTDGTRLVVTYSDKRAGKDAYNRHRGVLKLKARIKSGRLTKDAINNRGYNKFLAIKGDMKKIEVAIDADKIKEDKRWDGLKGYVTNTKLPSKAIVQNYRHLWQIEKAFRISKTDLRVRPIFHYRRRRIEAHISIAFVAYTIYKELERLLDKYYVSFSPRRAAELTHTMYELEYRLPKEMSCTKTLLTMDPEQQLLYDLIHQKPKIC